MKKLIIAAAALTTLTSSVYASKARVQALGDSVENNYFVDDSRRIFTNAAQIHNYNGMMMMELGGVGSAGDTDANDTPKAMGGFLTSCGNFICGVYLGNESTISKSLKGISTNTAATTGGTLKSSDNQIDLFIGGESSFKWGASFIYADYEDKLATGEKATSEALALKVGALGSNWESYINLSLGSDSTADKGYTLNGATPTTSEQKFEGKFGIQVGGAYNLSDKRKIYFTAKKFDWDITDGTDKKEGSLTHYIVGYGKTFEMTDSSNAFVRLSYDMLTINLEQSGVAKGELKNSVLPLVVGFESKAASWLTLRGSITHNLMGTAEGKNLGLYLDSVATRGAFQQGVASEYYGWDGLYLDGKKTIANSTVVSAGATLEFGKLSVDGFIGTTAGSRTGDHDTKEGVLSTDNLLTRVGMTYKF